MLQVLETAASVFADADEQYGDLTAVKRRLEAWKREQPGAYRDAYVSLSAPAIFAPFVRNELLSWDPVFQDAQGARAVLHLGRSPTNRQLQLDGLAIRKKPLHMQIAGMLRSEATMLAAVCQSGTPLLELASESYACNLRSI